MSGSASLAWLPPLVRLKCAAVEARTKYILPSKKLFGFPEATLRVN